MTSGRRERKDGQLRPLTRVGPGRYRSRDGRWVFLRHESDARPKRWYAYDGECRWAANDGLDHTVLRDAVAWAQRQP